MTKLKPLQVTDHRPKCPECGEPCEAEHVDIGVGWQQCEPWGCPSCMWVDTSWREALAVEAKVKP